MKKLLLIGDFNSNTGPANVNKNIKMALADKAVYCTKSRKFSRMLEMIQKIFISRNVLFCSFSKADVYGIKLSKLLRKKTFYLMHGYIKYEQEINGQYDAKRLEIEKYIINNVEKVFCVSKLMMDKVNKEYNLYNFDYVYNGIDFNHVSNKKISKNNYQIISTGGGIPQKNNLIVCEVIKKINKISPIKYKYVIIGNPHGYKEKFLEYDFVEYYEYLPHEECIKKMAESVLYIQNSLFETFGLAIAEALNCGCKILVSKNVGIIDLLQNINENEIINDTNDVKEIFEKICILIKPQYKSNIVMDKKKNSIVARAMELYNKIIDYK